MTIELLVSGEAKILETFNEEIRHGEFNIHMATMKTRKARRNSVSTT